MNDDQFHPNSFITRQEIIYSVEDGSSQNTSSTSVRILESPIQKPLLYGTGHWTLRAVVVGIGIEVCYKSSPLQLAINITHILLKCSIKQNVGVLDKGDENSLQQSPSFTVGETVLAWEHPHLDSIFSAISCPTIHSI